MNSAESQSIRACLKKHQTAEPYQGTAREAGVEVAGTLEEGLRHLYAPPEAQGGFREPLPRAYAAVKSDECEKFNRVISSWERQHLLLQV